MFKRLRLAEIQDSIELLRKYKVSGDVLEIGAGTGWQSKALSEAGYHVEAVDLPSENEISNHAGTREWPICDYDGVHLPFADRSFDVIYSSNVLEHVVPLEALAADMKRVLRPGGIALHLIPNPQWRLLSLLTYYPAQAVDFFRWLRRSETSVSNDSTTATSHSECSLLTKAARRLLPPTHGAEGTPLTEISRFSKRYWDGFFRQGGWEVLHYGNNGIAASGDYLLGSALGMSTRRVMGRAMGGIAHVYVVRTMARE